MFSAVTVAISLSRAAAVRGRDPARGRRGRGQRRASSRCWSRSPWCPRCSRSPAPRMLRPWPARARARPAPRAGRPLGDVAARRGLLLPAGPARCSAGPGWWSPASCTVLGLRRRPGAATSSCGQLRRAAAARRRPGAAVLRHPRRRLPDRRRSPPVQVVGRATPEQMTPLAEQVGRASTASRAVAPPQPVGDGPTRWSSVFTAGTDPGSDAAKAVVAALRDDRPGYRDVGHRPDRRR